MGVRLIQDEEELQELILEVVLDKKEQFTMSEIVEDVKNHKRFNRNICSFIKLEAKVSEIIDILLEVCAIKGESEFPNNPTEKFQVIT